MLISLWIYILEDWTVSSNMVDYLKSCYCSSLPTHQLFALGKVVLTFWALLYHLLNAGDHMLAKHLMGQLLISGGDMKVVVFSNDLCKWRDCLYDAYNVDFQHLRVES